MPFAGYSAISTHTSPSSTSGAAAWASNMRAVLSLVEDAKEEGYFGVYVDEDVCI
jgi:hypothetical protein